MIRCPVCITNWVDRAAGLAGVELGELPRRRLIAALLSRPHLLLSGPPGIGKGQLAHALALSAVDGERERVCSLQGHPWWAANTADVSHFVELQTDFSLWRLAHFVHSVVNGRGRAAQHTGTGLDRTVSHNSTKARPAHSVCAYVAWINRVSPVEIELYFRVVAEWLLGNGKGASISVPLRLVGTFDGSRPADLDDRILRATALVHLSGAPDVVPGNLWPGANTSSRAQV